MCASDKSRCESSETGDWKYVAASVCGPSHTELEKPCQDRFGVQGFGDFFVAIVSDGAGTAELGGEGAEIVGNTFLIGVR